MSDALACVQSAYAAFGRGDIPALLQTLAPDVRWQFRGDRASAYTGDFARHGQVGEWFGCVAQADAIQAFEPREFLAGPDHVTVIGWERTASTSSGKVFECEWVHVWTVRDGLITRFWGMLDSESSAAAR